MMNNSENSNTPTKSEGKSTTPAMAESSQFHGLLLVDKPSGISSHDVVARLRRIMGTRSVGHS
ncbi:MAG: tRNA pseudouridine(55) synthase TruB, partial [Bdellovibrio sp.]